MDKSMNDLGETWPMSSCGCDECKDKNKDKKMEKHYPLESFTTEQMPELKSVTVGDRVIITIEAVVRGVSQGDEYEVRPMAPGEDDEQPKTRVSLKLMSGMVEKKGKAPSDDKKTMSQKEDDKATEFNQKIGLEESPEEE